MRSRPHPQRLYLNPLLHCHEVEVELEDFLRLCQALKIKFNIRDNKQMSHKFKIFLTPPLCLTKKVSPETSEVYGVTKVFTWSWAVV